jgi:hypothetical protein
MIVLSTIAAYACEICVFNGLLWYSKPTNLAQFLCLVFHYRFLTVDLHINAVHFHAMSLPVSSNSISCRRETNVKSVILLPNRSHFPS